jgi:hypothetical protein
MKEPKILPFNPPKSITKNNNFNVEIVDQPERRSKVKVVIDKAGEICLKTPKAIPQNEDAY